MLEQGVNWQWNAPKGVFQSEVFDPISRVKTRWQKSPGGLAITRIDESEDGFRRERIGMESGWISCNVDGEDENGIDKILLANGGVIELVLSDPQDRLGLVSAKYNFQGDFLSASVGNLLKGKSDVDNNKFYDRSLEENFRELAELIKYRGAVIMTEGFFYGQKDPSVEKQLETDKLDTDFRLLARDWGQEVVNIINKGLQTIMDPLIDESSIEQSRPGSRDDILQLLGRNVIRTLPHNFIDLSASSRLFQIRNAIFASLAQNLASYYIRPGMLNHYFVEFTQVPVDGLPRFAVHIKNSEFEDILSGEVAEGQLYRYQDHDYSTRKRDEKIIVAVEPIMKPQLGVEIELPAQIEVQRILDYMNTEQNIGWEKALDLVPVSIR